MAISSAEPAPAPAHGSLSPSGYLGETPAALLKRIDFGVTRRLDGFLFGDYSGLFYGPSLDLAEVREYQPGDEVRRIDWNVTARSGILHVRQYREEREVRAWLIVDLSSSMAFGTRRRRKEELAIEFAGLAASVLTRRGNKVGAFCFSEGGTTSTPLGSGRRTPLLLIRSLLEVAAMRDERPMAPPATRRTRGTRGPAGRARGSRARSPAATEEGGGQEQGPGGRTPAAARKAGEGPSAARATLEAGLEQADRTLHRKALVFLVSDFIDSAVADGSAGPPPWEGALRRLALRHEVVAVKVSDPAERELPKAGELRLRDPETGRELWVDTADPRVRREYARLVAERRAVLESSLRRSRVDLLELSTAEGIVPPVVRFTLQRRGRRQAA